MNLTSLPAVPGARKRRKRVGRGIGSGHGKTSTRGQKGQRARTGSGKRPGFEGGQNPLIRRLPKRGFRRKATGRTRKRQIVNVEQLNQFLEGSRVGPERLEEAGLIRDRHRDIKVLGDGTLSKRLTIAVHAISVGAKEKIARAGGTVELLGATSSVKPPEAAAPGAPPSTRTPDDRPTPARRAEPGDPKRRGAGGGATGDEA